MSDPTPALGDKTSFEAACRLAPIALAVPEIGGLVYLRHLSAREAQDVGKLAKAEHLNFWALLAVRALSDADGRPLFETKDVVAVADLPNRIVQRIGKAALDMNALSEEGQEEVEAELEGQAENPTESP